MSQETPPNPPCDRRSSNLDERLQRVEIDVAIMKSDHQQIKTDIREVRSLLDKSEERGRTMLRAVVMTLVTTLTSALGYVLWQILIGAIHGSR